MKGSERNSVSLVIEVITIILAILFLANYIRLIANSGFLTFESFIQQCSNFSSIQLTQLIDLTIDANWGIFNFLRNFINMFTNLISVLLYLGSMVLNALWFVTQFLAIFFV